MNSFIKINLLLLLVGSYLNAYSQTNAGNASIKGHVKSVDGEAIPGVIVSLKNQSHGTQTDEHGAYHITDIPPGTYTLIFGTVGFYRDSVIVSLQENETLKHDTRLKHDSTTIEVTVISKTEVQKIKESEFAVNVIDATKFSNRASDLNQVLNYVSGVRVRESGGVGSSFNFSLNGFTGRQVKFFIDGVPMDNFGSSFQLNNIPINLAERIEVYKGVVPIWLGSDALGGAINIITNTKPQTYLDASYSYGSFNTHKSSINTGYTAKSGLTAQVNFFQNYSDNNYWVDVESAQSNGLYKKVRVRRFHDTYRNETVILSAGVVGKKYADKLLVGITLGQNRAEIQTGARMVSVFGDWYRTGNIIMPSIKYKKDDLFIKGLSLSISANYNMGQEQNVDTVNRRYNWEQDYTSPSPYTPGSERSRSLYKYRNNVGVMTSNLIYQLNEKHAFMLNYVYNSFNRVGSDELTPGSQSNQQPRKTNKSVFGLGYKYDLNKRWSTSIFLKQYIQKNISSLSYTPANTTNTEYRVQKAIVDQTGYGIATTYFLLPKLQLKASYEKSYRLPENEELFGDMINLEGNTNIKPESSDNINLGLTYTPTIKQNHQLLFDVNFIYRDAKDYIRPSLNTNQTMQVMVNQGKVLNTGVNGEIRYSYKRLFSIGGNVTYQNLINNTKYDREGDTKVSTVYLDRMPNIPYLFGNADVNVSFSKIGGKRNTISLSYNLVYVHEYYLRWPSQGHDKKDIPKQISHDVTMVYAIANGKYNIALECRNLSDNKLYDNFTLQKPGRSFYIKLRYFFRK